MAIAILSVTALAFASVPPMTANALVKGDSVTFLIRSDQIQPQPPSGPQDGLVFTGRAASSIDITGCGTGTHPVQEAVLRDVAGGQSGLIEVIVATETDPVPAGTELKTFTPNGSCFIGSNEYFRYVGTVTRTQ